MDVRDQRTNSVIIVYDDTNAVYEAAARACAASLKTVAHVSRIRLKKLKREITSGRAGALTLYIAVGARSAKALATSIPESSPLLYCMVSSPERLGLLDRPATGGVRADVSPATQLALLHRAFPKAKTIGVLFRNSSAVSRSALQRAAATTPDGVRLVTVDVDAKGSITAALDALFRSQIDTLWTIADPAVFNAASVRATLLRSLQEQIPIFGFSMPLVRAGAAIGVNVSPEAQGRQVAAIAAKVLQDPTGAAVSQQMEPSIEVVVNSVVLKRLGKTPASTLLADAIEVGNQ